MLSGHAPSHVVPAAAAGAIFPAQGSWPAVKLETGTAVYIKMSPIPFSRPPWQTTYHVSSRSFSGARQTAAPGGKPGGRDDVSAPSWSSPGDSPHANQTRE